MPKTFLRFAAAAAAVLGVVIAGSCGGPPTRLDVSKRRACVAQGGYESRSAFGFPICQFRYADGGKACTDKADCEGKCRLSVDGPPQKPIPEPSQLAKGVCQSEHYSPGCFAIIEGGKVTAAGAFCED
jgi:hypothetical protein